MHIQAGRNQVASGAIPQEGYIGTQFSHGDARESACVSAEPRLDVQAKRLVGVLTSLQVLKSRVSNTIGTLQGHQPEKASEASGAQEVPVGTLNQLDVVIYEIEREVSQMHERAERLQGLVG